MSHAAGEEEEAVAAARTAATGARAATAEGAAETAEGAAESTLGLADSAEAIEVIAAVQAAKEIEAAAPSDKKGADAAGLLRKVVRETLSFGTFQVIGSLLSWGAGFLLARLLTQTDYGVYDICASFVQMGILFSDAGLGGALLRKKEEPSDEEYSSVFVANMTAGVVLAVGFAIAAPWLISVYKIEHPMARWVLTLMGPSYLLSAARTYPMLRLERQLAFGSIARIDLAVTLAKHVGAISLGLLQAGVMTLVLSNLGSSVLALVLTFVLMPKLPKPIFRWVLFKPLLAFGLQAQALTITAFFKDNVSNLLLGALLGPEAVGVFNRGITYVGIPMLLVNGLARIQLPTYARLQDDPEGLFLALRGALRLCFLTGVPLIVVFSCGYEGLIPLLYGSKWLAAGPVAQAASLNMIGGLAAGPYFTLLFARGEAGFALRTFLVWTGATWLLVVLLHRAGLGLVGVGLAHSLVTVPIVIFLHRHIRPWIAHSLLPSLALPPLAGALAVVAHLLARFLLPAAIGHHPVTGVALPLFVYLTVLLGSERGRIVGEIRGLLQAAKG